jgi:hypothetical protein
MTSGCLTVGDRCRCAVTGATDRTITCTMPPGASATGNVRAALVLNAPNYAGNPTGVVARAWYGGYSWRPQLTPRISALAPTALQAIDDANTQQTLQLTWSVPLYHNGPSVQEIGAVQAYFQSGHTHLPAAQVRVLSWRQQPPAALSLVQ